MTGRQTPLYDDQNIFARILRGELPCAKITEDEKTFAFMDIMPRADGHALVVPKAPVRNILDASPADLMAVMTMAQQISHAQMNALGAEGITIQQFNETAGGQEVFHLHVHVIPRFIDRDLTARTNRMADPEALKIIADRIAAALS